MAQAKILLVDDDARVRRVICSILSRRADWEVCGEAADGQESVELARSMKPDVVVMDVSMPRMNGLEATRILRREMPQIEVILVSQNDPNIVCRQAAEVGARAYCSKSDVSRNLLSIIERALEDRRNLHANIAWHRFGPKPSDEASNVLAATVDSSNNEI